ncbi:MAG: tRNA (adenosine(37)-N6)-dimethylallyltransferase MiaA [Anaerolineae bacterium]|nr:tRNA (adenosine(37)-N6)-dimethylallyltransferase MiaA [Anaerolineae bacterium]
METPLIVVLGPTAVGKTDLALAIAQALDGEILGADSRQIYRYMDIGTAKPNPDQRAAVPHHLIDIVNPDENLALAQYQQMAYAAIADVHTRGRVPLLVGGTGQYITAVIEGWSIPAVAPNDALRAELEAYAAEHGSEALHARLQALDPDAAAAIHHRNVRRVVRALEVSIEARQPISQLQQKHPPPYRVMQHGLTMDKDRLLERSDRRVDQMMAQGFLGEVQNLLDRGFSRKLPAMSGLGYAQLTAHLLDGVPLADAIDATKRDTRAFIRRQYTWFRGHDTGIIWHDVETLNHAALIEACARRLEM